MMLTLGQAARLAGIGKSALARAIQAGRLRATRREDGGYLVDAAELERVCTLPKPATDATGGATADIVHRATAERDVETAAMLAALASETRGLRELVEEMRRTRDSYERQLTETTAALAARTRLLPGPDMPARRSWWLWRRAS